MKAWVVVGLIGFLTIMIGRGLNSAVVAANGGLFPVAVTTELAPYVPSGYVPMTAGTQYHWLGDIIRVGHHYYSMGDFVQLLGTGIITLFAFYVGAHFGRKLNDKIVERKVNA